MSAHATARPQVGRSAPARRWVLAWAGLGLAALAACSSPSKPTPAPLEAVTAKIAGKQIWRQSLGEPVAALSVAVVGDRFVLASRDGVVLSYDVATGAERSRVALGVKLSAGVGSDGRYSAVVSDNNDLVLIDGAKERWRIRLSSRVVTAPLVAGERVFIQMVDRTIQAYDVLDARRLWSLARSGEPLALAQAGLLLPYKDTLLAGQGSRLVAIDPLTGSVRNEVGLPAQRGTNEVERLADLVGPAARVGDVVCARAFQSSVGCIQVERAVSVWTRTFGGYQGLAADADFVFAADGSDRISAWKRASGDIAWTSERLRNRGLSAPLVSGSTVVFGDFEGWLHFLSRDRGETLLRLPTDSSGIAAPLVRSGQTLLAVSRSGGVYAFRPQ
ncbi:outer membrane assembly lipoprotein YfgL [Leptothrix cholodnii SP-6]|uniref:Outer membrane protein assembly factor BamB n=1 Tax=Leptothrix cholodnii (strain ATCC 51168 / LMG 8142 / SP-6) TaxID=395495 RepID=B1XXL0_LEPCP|nr:PQQ-binding-like beta-propeller repeat protein [Leptothrix cholodnii]ACB35130.1 outer membrane assembly lipoprotein YfgL [Leptothrix cholodnii SP-6]